MHGFASYSLGKNRESLIRKLVSFVEVLFLSTIKLLVIKGNVLIVTLSYLHTYYSVLSSC